MCYCSKPYGFVSPTIMSRGPIVNGYFYHVFNRGVDKRRIFMNTGDYLRFMHNLYEFNDKNYILPYPRRQTIEKVGLTKPYSEKKERIKLVDVCCFCLMPNHFHLILRQIIDNGISLFLKKLSMGYANYFNLKYERSGALFQGRFKTKLVGSDEQMMHLSRYIHLLNPGELVEPKIREGVIRDKRKLEQFLKNYKWSSYLDFIGIKNYPSIINKDFLIRYFKDEKDYEKFVMSWAEKDLIKIKDIMLE